MEAVQIRLTGELASYYHVYYRVHSQYFGWLGWAKDGESAGTSSLSLRIEAIQIKLVPKKTVRVPIRQERHTIIRIAIRIQSSTSRSDMCRRR